MNTVFFKVSVPLFLAGLVLSLTACPPALDSGAGKLRLALSGGGARAALSPDTINSLSYKLVFSGPGGETLSREAGPGTGALSLTLSPGRWNIRAEAFEEGRPFGLGETAVTVEAGKTAEAALSMKFSPVWYVAGTGAPGGAGDDDSVGSEAAPLATVAKALAKIAASYNGGDGWPNNGAPAPARIVISGTITAGSNEILVNIDTSGLGSPRYPSIILAGATANDSENSIDADGNAVVVSIVNADLTLGPGLTLTGGSNPDSSGNGGGVYVEATLGSTASFTMTGGTINGNSAKYGGGVYVLAIDYSRAFFTMTGGTISGNTAAFNGGGVYVGATAGSTASFTMRGGTISGNTAAFNGGGVYVDDGGTFTKNGGTIYGDDGDDLKKNTAGTLFTPGDGHAVYADPSNWRNDTAGPGIMLNSSLSGSEGGWDGDAS